MCRPRKPQASLELGGLAPALMEDTGAESLQEAGACCAHSRAGLRAPRALTTRQTQRSQEWGEKGPQSGERSGGARREAARGREQGHAHQEQGGACRAERQQSTTRVLKQGHGTQREDTQETGLTITQSCQGCPISTWKGAHLTCGA